MSYTISKLKVKKGLPEIHYSVDRNGFTSTHIVTINGLVHSDLADALDRLKTHLCLITELVNPMHLGGISAVMDLFNNDELHQDPAFMTFKCTGFSLSSDGVVLTGNKTLGTSKVLNLVSPFTLLTEESDYDFALHLNVHVQELINETEQLLEGKMSGEQLDLFAEQDAA